MRNYGGASAAEFSIIKNTLEYSSEIPVCFFFLGSEPTPRYYLELSSLPCYIGHSQYLPAKLDNCLSEMML